VIAVLIVMAVVGYVAVAMATVVVLVVGEVVVVRAAQL
jgi:hypothetical protein